jgi:serine/threonine-protein kinase HipA
VVDKDGSLFIAKFPSRNDDHDTGAWEDVVLRLAKASGIDVPEGYARNFSGKWSTFLVRRFDRTKDNVRIHFASAMTLLHKTDGDGAQSGVSYLDIAKFASTGAKPDVDLPQLWRRVAFNVCVSNVDDHLRNHGFLLTKAGWVLSPAYDMNPVHPADGLSLNISENSNALDLDVVVDVASYFRIKSKDEATKIVRGIAKEVANWRSVASQVGLSRSDQDRMAPAFRVAEEFK